MCGSTEVYGTSMTTRGDKFLPTPNLLHTEDMRQNIAQFALL